MDELHEHDIEYYPLDFDAVQKGDVITLGRLEQLTGHKRGTDKHRLAVLSLRERIVSECADRGKHVTVAIIKGDLRVLTDEEAAVYNVRTFRAGFRRSGRSFRRLSKVNVTALTDCQKKTHERNLIVFGKMLQAARNSQRSIAATPHERSLPGIPGVVETE